MYLKEHYVYAYYDEQGQPYYIGKGRGNRCFVRHHLKVPSHKKIKKLYENLTNLVACDIEENLILKFGRKDLGTGLLLNRKSRSNPYSHSKKAKEKLKKIMKFLKSSPKSRKNHSEKMRATLNNKERRKSMADRTRKLWQDFNFRNKISKAIKKGWTDEVKEKRSEKAKLFYQNLENRLVLSERMKKRMRDPELRKRISLARKAYWNQYRLRKTQSKLL